MFKHGLRAGLVLALLLSLSGSALAHGYIVRSIPEDRTVFERAPARLQYWFSEALEPKFSSLSVRDQMGKVIASGGLAADNNALLTVKLPRGLPDGAYIVDMRLAFSSDGHVAAQSRVFFVGKEVAGVTGGTASSEANPLEVMWRVLLYTSTIVLFGVFSLYGSILVPAWGNSSYPAGWLPPRVMRRLSLIIIVALAVAFAANLLAILQQTMAFFRADAAQVVGQNLWSAVRVGTRFGEVWTARLVLLVLVALTHGMCLFFSDDQPDVIRPFWTANAWVMALVLGAFSVTSHAAGSLLLPWLAIAADWLHGLAVGFWAGGLVVLVLVLPSALQPYQGDGRRLALLAVLKRFSRMAVTCIVIVVSTGIYSASNWFYTPNDVTQTSFGGALIVKLLLVAGLLFIGLLHHIALRPERYQGWQQIINRVNNFIPTLRLEAIVAVLTLIAVSVLSATPVPVPDFAKQSIASPSQRQTVNGYGVMLTLSPGGPGVNTYDILITRDGKPANDLNVYLQLVNPERDWRGELKPAEAVDDGLYVSAGDEIDREGHWLALLDIVDISGMKTRAAFTWTISNQAAIVQSRNLNTFNVLALAGVIAAIGFVLFPSARRVYQRLDLSPAAVTVAVGAVVATIFVTVIGFAAVEESQARYDAILNPPPTVINPIVPDAASLERGAALYADHCAAWPANPDYPTLVEHLIHIRDDELFTATSKGRGRLPACDNLLTDAQRWDMVNFLRTLAKPTVNG
jgi:copper transport protein